MKGQKETITRQLVTPEQAKTWLSEKYEKQRPIRSSVVNMYANDMINDSWDESIVNPIRITKSGKLIDGQHRLQAIITANKPILMWVQTNLDDKAFDSIDIGARRKPSDIIGGANATTASSIARCMAGILYGTAGIQGACHSMKFLSPKTTIPMSDVIEAYNTEDVQKYVSIGRKMKQSLSCGSVTYFAFAMWIIDYLYGEEVMDIFADDFLSDSPFPTSNVVRNYLTSSFLTGKRVERERIVEAILFAYDNFSHNKVMKLFRGSGAVLRKYNALIAEKRLGSK